MTDLDALHRAILDHPDDDTPRLIYADALDDAGEASRAAFIRGQVEADRVPDSDPARVRWQYHGRRAFDAAWRLEQLPDLPAGLQWAADPFRRGFPAAVEAGDGSDFVAHAEELSTLAPVEELHLTAIPASATDLARCPWLGRIARLVLSDGLTRVGATWLLNSEHLNRLTDLTVGARLTTAPAAEAVIRSRAFRRLRAFGCRDDSHTRARMYLTPLARLTNPPRLVKLDLSGNMPRNRSGATPLEALVAAPILEAVEDLDLSENNLGPEGVSALAAARLPALRTLRLRSVRLEEEGIQALAGAELLTELRCLELTSDNLGPLAARLLADSPLAANLRVLDLHDNRLGDRGADALAASPHLTNLIHLDLADNRIGDRGADALLRMSHLDQLIVLDLGGNDLSAAAKQRLTDRFGPRVFL